MRGPTLFTANEMLKCYFKIKNLRLCSPVINLLDKEDKSKNFDIFYDNTGVIQHDLAAVGIINTP